MANETFDYVVLSHMWGTSHEHQLVLLSANLEAFQTGIPYSHLIEAAIYIEAIRITRLLGYQYLWIDSLCIIQNSLQDWAYEASRMAIVYGNAVCNIASLFPARDVGEAEVRNEPRDWNPCILRKVTPEVDGVYIKHEKRGWLENEDLSGMAWLMPRNWPLFDRAWTFQEYLLAPRTLLVGHKNLMFQCSNGFYDELLGPIDGVVGEKVERSNLGGDLGKTKYFPASLKEVARADSPSNLVVLSFMYDWMKIVNEYRSRRLRHGEDRIMAFAGIARAFSQMAGMTYLAGAWREFLPLCLLWHVGKKPKTVVRAHLDMPNGVYIDYIAKVREHAVRSAPSWSWFSVPIHVFHQLNLLLDEDDIMAQQKAGRDSPLVCFQDIHWAKTVAFQFDSHDANAFPSTAGYSDLADLHVTLSMPTLPVSVNWPIDLIAQMQIIQAQLEPAEKQDFDFSPSFKYFPDDIVNGSNSPPNNGILALVAEHQIVRTAGFTVQRYLAGLILIPGLEVGVWERVGAWKLKMRVSGVVVNAASLQDVSQKWREYKVVSEQWTWGDITVA